MPNPLSDENKRTVVTQMRGKIIDNKIENDLQQFILDAILGNYTFPDNFNPVLEDFQSTYLDYKKKTALLEEGVKLLRENSTLKGKINNLKNEIESINENSGQRKSPTQRKVNAAKRKGSKGQKKRKNSPSKATQIRQKNNQLASVRQEEKENRNKITENQSKADSLGKNVRQKIQYITDLNEFITNIRTAIEQHLSTSYFAELLDTSLLSAQSADQGKIKWSSGLLFFLYKKMNAVNQKFAKNIFVQLILDEGMIRWRVNNNDDPHSHVFSNKMDENDFKNKNPCSMTWEQFEAFKNSGKRSGRRVIDEETFVNQLPLEKRVSARSNAIDIFNELKAKKIITSDNHLSEGWRIMSVQELNKNQKEKLEKQEGEVKKQDVKLKSYCYKFKHIKFNNFKNTLEKFNNIERDITLDAFCNEWKGKKSKKYAKELWEYFIEVRLPKGDDGKINSFKLKIANLNSEFTAEVRDEKKSLEDIEVSECLNEITKNSIEKIVPLHNAPPLSIARPAGRSLKTWQNGKIKNFKPTGDYSRTEILDVGIYKELSDHKQLHYKEIDFDPNKPRYKEMEFDHIPACEILKKCNPSNGGDGQEEDNDLWWTIAIPPKLHSQGRTHGKRNQDKVGNPFLEDIKAYLDFLEEYPDKFLDLKDRYLEILGAFRYLYRCQVKTYEPVDGRKVIGSNSSAFFTPSNKKDIDKHLQDRIKAFIKKIEDLKDEPAPQQVAMPEPV